MALTSLHVLLTVIAKFDLQTLQFDVVTIFVYADLDEIVFIIMPSKYGK